MRNLVKLILFLSCSFKAYADVRIYGKLVAGIQNSTSLSNVQANTSSIQDYGSYFGIRGSEQITDQTAFIWQVEQLLNISLGQTAYLSTANGLIVPQNNYNTISGKVLANYNQLASSDSYIGLRGIWGVLNLGNISNYLRSNMGAVDIFNYANSSNGLEMWSRTSNYMILPNSFAYNSTSWHGFTLGIQYSANTLFTQSSNNYNIPVNSETQNGTYSGGIYSYGLAWQYGKYKINYGGQLWVNVGSYASSTITIPNNAQYGNAYVNRLELSYNDPYGLYIALGAQITDGLGWYSWANSGGAFNSYIANPGFNYSGLQQAQYQTQEFALSAAYHFGMLTPKIAYAYGNNLMYGGNPGTILVGSAAQIPNSGYQQINAELDLNFTPKTILFVNYGQIWFGNTLSNINYCGLNCNATTNNNYLNYFNNQATFAMGLSYLF